MPLTKILYGKNNLFYVIPSIGKSFLVMHKQITGSDRICAEFRYDWSVSKTRALKGAKVFCKQMNIYYPARISWFNATLC